MSPFQGVVTAAALVLLASGVAKLARPEATARALFAARLPHRRSFVFALGGAEVVLGAAGLVVAGPVVAITIVLTFVAFDLFIWRMHAVGGAEGCGCFGAESDVSPGSLHVALNLLLAVGSLAAAGGSQSVLDAVTDDTARGLALLAASAAAAFLLVLAYTRLATVLELTRGGTPTSTPPVRSFQLAPPIRRTAPR